MPLCGINLNLLGIKIAVYLCLTSFLLPLDILSRGFFSNFAGCYFLFHNVIKNPGYLDVISRCKIAFSYAAITSFSLKLH